MEDTERPTCSVVMTAFRSAAYIEEAAASVLAQTLGHLELIVVDDGCPDASASLVASLGDDRVTIHRQENRGSTRARLAGLRLARGRAIVFLDADDRLRPEALGRLWSALETEPTATVAYGRAARIDTLGRPMGPWHRPITSPEPSGDVLEVLLRLNFIRCPGAALIRATCFDRTHGFDPDAFPGADWELWCRLALLGPFVAVRGAAVVDYRSHPSSMTLRLADAPDAALRVVDLVYGNQALVGRLSTARRSALRRAREASMYGWLATECLRAGETTRAARLFSKGIECAPADLRLRVLWLFAVAGWRPPWF